MPAGCELWPDGPAPLQRHSVDLLCASFDRGRAGKLTLIAPWIDRAAPGAILDVGMGGGAVSAGLASRFAQHDVVGVDINPEMVGVASDRHGPRPNLRFTVGDATQSFGDRGAVVVLSSVLHEVYSSAGFSLDAVQCALRCAWNALRSGGRLIVRDFARPAAASRAVTLMHRRTDIVAGHDFAAFAGACRWPVALDAVTEGRHWIGYATDLASAYDYLLRKDFHDLWQHQLAERYGFWTRATAEATIRRTGYRIIHSSEWRSGWVTRRRLDGKVSMRCRRTGEPIAPSHQLLIVAVKETG